MTSLPTEFQETFSCHFIYFNINNRVAIHRHRYENGVLGLQSTACYCTVEQCIFKNCLLKCIIFTVLLICGRGTSIKYGKFRPQCLSFFLFYLIMKVPNRFREKHCGFIFKLPYTNTLMCTSVFKCLILTST